MIIEKQMRSIVMSIRSPNWQFLKTFLTQPCFFLIVMSLLFLFFLSKWIWIVFSIPGQPRLTNSILVISWMMSFSLYCKTFIVLYDVYSWSAEINWFDSYKLIYLAFGISNAVRPTFNPYLEININNCQKTLSHMQLSGFALHVSYVKDYL